MRDSALAFLACPSCRRTLVLESGARSDDGHVLRGALACTGCAARYAIVDGVPHLVTADVAAAATATATRFGKEWRLFGEMATYQERWFRNWLAPLGPDDFRDRIVFEGGCGKGRHTVVAAGWGARAIVALDLGDAVNVAFANTRHLSSVHVVRGDLLRPPVARAFDVAFSIGVLHHLPTPRAGFDALRSVVCAGGRVAIWVYGYESNEWIVRWINPLRERVTARLPIPALYWLSLPPSLALAAFAKLYRTPLADLLPYRAYLRELAALPVREIHTIVFDQLVTPIAFYLAKAEVASWFDNSELTDVKISWHNENSWRGSARVLGPGVEHGP